MSIKDIKSRNPRLKKFIDPSIISIIEKGETIFENFDKFEESGNVDKLKTIKQFLNLESSFFIEISENPELEEQINNLSNDCSSIDFPSRWADIISIFSQIKASFDNFYLESHQKQVESVQLV